MNARKLLMKRKSENIFCFEEKKRRTERQTEKEIEEKVIERKRDEGRAAYKG